MYRAAIENLELRNDPTVQVQETEVCERIEIEIRRHARLIASYGYATSEGLDDLREGLSSLVNVCESRQESERDGELIGWIRNLKTLADSIQTDISACTNTSDQLCTRIIEQLRQSPIGNRRSELRLPIELPCVLHHRSDSLVATTLDISNRGAKIKLHQIGRSAIVKFDQMQVNIANIGVFDASIVRVESNVIHILFASGSDVAARNLQTVIDRFPRLIEEVMTEFDSQQIYEGHDKIADRAFLNVKKKLPELTAARMFLQHEAGTEIWESSSQFSDFDWPNELVGTIFSLGNERDCSVSCKDGQLVVSVSNSNASIKLVQFAIDSRAFALSEKPHRRASGALPSEHFRADQT